ncbi:flagellar basal body P-ring protein FlgI [bacterium]|nr:flagellar basal body P-ring protein FlgI [bacterium]
MRDGSTSLQRRSLEILLLATLLAGAGQSIRAADDTVMRTPDYDTTGDGSGFDGLQPFRVEGLGFVTGLEGTGSDPPNNTYRRLMIETMKKRGVESPADVLRSTNSCLALLRTTVPPGGRKGDLVDVEVWIPPGDDAKSLKGGFLLETDLKEHVIAKGKHIKNKGTLEGDAWVRVDGPILVMADEKSEAARAASLKKGRVLGRGRLLADRDFRLMLEDGKKSKARSRQISEQINQRFRSIRSEASRQIAVPLDYQTIKLGIPIEYIHNTERFLHVVRRIPMSRSKTFQEQILGFLEADLMNPETTIEASLRLEAIGPSSMTVLKEGLLADNDLVQFCSAQSLAYMKDPAGYKILAQLADRSNLYRAYALAALISHDQPLARTHLTRLLSSQSSEARYGAFRSLWMMDQTDPLVRPILMGPDEFSIHAVESEGPPMIHLSRNFRREIVLFQPNQQFVPPMTMQVGDHLTVTASAGTNEVHLYSSRPSSQGVREQRQMATTSILDVIEKASNLGATYPDIVDLLMQASANNNLSGRLEINALPRPQSYATIESIANDKNSQRWLGFHPATPNLFQDGDQPVAGGTIGQGLRGPARASIVKDPDEEESEEGETASSAPKKRRFFPMGRAAN